MADTDPILRFEFISSENQRKRSDGYGAGTLFLNDHPFWYSASQDAPGSVEWTWVDFLEHIAEVWDALMVEQSYPFDWLNKQATHPGEMWDKAELRWSLQGDTVADEEEPILYAFHNRHNLSAGWKGIGLPALYWLRIGKSVWLAPEGGLAIRADFNECKRSLEAICNQLADSFAGSDNARVIAAMDAWGARKDSLRKSFFRFATGLGDVELAVVEQGRPQAEYWEISQFANFEEAAENDSELLAAARMTKGILPPASISALIEIIRQIPKVNTPELDDLGVRASKFLANSNQLYAHESGYRLAQWLREQLGLEVRAQFDVLAYLHSLGVSIVSEKFGSDHIDALACWGRHGPSIVSNLERAFAHDTNRLRMSLAHELCHFLVDRGTALPVAEVLGGGVDAYVERRAYAFAAELLLPRAGVISAGEMGHTTLQDQLRFLGTTFGVSKAVACAQVFNSPLFSAFSAQEREYVKIRLQRFAELKFPDEKIYSGIT